MSQINVWYRGKWQHTNPHKCIKQNILYNRELKSVIPLHWRFNLPSDYGTRVLLSTNSWIAPLPFPHLHPRRRVRNNRGKAYSHLISLQWMLEKKPRMKVHFTEFMQKMLDNCLQTPSPNAIKTKICNLGINLKHCLTEKMTKKRFSMFSLMNLIPFVLYKHI